MMVLLNGPVVVEHGKVGARLDVEVVGGSRVVVVVDNRGEEQGEDLQVRQPILQPGLRDEPVRRLKNTPPLYSPHSTLDVKYLISLEIIEEYRMPSQLVFCSF